MQIYPAIDLMDGKAVRLTRGDFDTKEVFSDSPLNVLQSFTACGATNLHVVDLDGARTGSAVNFEVIEELARVGGVFIEVGGGMRNLNRAERYLKSGANRIILGTAAVKDEGFVKEALAAFGDAVAVGADACNGFIAIDGWVKVTDIDAFGFCERMRDFGVKNIIYTDIGTDGSLSGTNLAAFEKLVQIDGLNIIASGGVTFPEEITKLKEVGVSGVIIGKALYKGVITLEEALRRAAL